jgi:predicted membrane protein
MGESESKGRWRLGTHTSVVAMMGECHLDLSRAEIDGPEVLITAVGLMGAVDIVVPEGIDVELTGLSIMGSRSLQVRDVPALQGSPRVVVRAFPIMGEVKVRTSTAAVETTDTPRLNI